MRTRSARWLVAFVAFVGVVLALAIATIGPNTNVICGRGNLLERIAQKYPFAGGVIDGANASYCTVPSTGSWIVSGVVLVAFIFLALVVRRQADSVGV